jgi:hypothetical protein
MSHYVINNDMYQQYHLAAFCMLEYVNINVKTIPLYVI